MSKAYLAHRFGETEPRKTFWQETVERHAYPLIEKQLGPIKVCLLIVSCINAVLLALVLATMR